MTKTYLIRRYSETIREILTITNSRIKQNAEMVAEDERKQHPKESVWVEALII